MNSSAQPPDPSCCPLCGRSNQCQLCTLDAYKGGCWCASVEIPGALLARVPVDLRNRVCLCERCVQEFHRQNAQEHQTAVPAGDGYRDANGLVVFTSDYLRRRGYCCDNGCRHCPYPE